MDNDVWGGGWREVRAAWPLDPALAHLNHGSFGAAPSAVLAEQQRLRDLLERNPGAFLTRTAPEVLAAARERAAAFLHLDPAGLAFVPNASAGVATVLASIPFEPGDEIVSTDHTYPAVRNAIAHTCARTGARPVEVEVPFFDDPAEPAALVVAAVNERTRLVLIDHVTSATALRMPVEAVVAACRARGVEVFVDGAHGPGLEELDLGALAPDHWTGNFHKWVCAPKGAAALWVAERHRERVRPLVTSHGYGKGLHAEFDWTGTNDPTAILAVPAAIAFLERLGWGRLRAHNHALVRRGREVVAAALGVTLPHPDDPRLYGPMATMPLPARVRCPDEEHAAALRARISRDAGAEVAVLAWKGRGWLRLSGQAYNAPGEYEALAARIGTIL